MATGSGASRPASSRAIIASGMTSGGIALSRTSTLRLAT